MAITPAKPVPNNKKVVGSGTTVMVPVSGTVTCLVAGAVADDWVAPVVEPRSITAELIDRENAPTPGVAKLNTVGVLSKLITTTPFASVKTLPNTDVVNALGLVPKMPGALNSTSRVKLPK